MSSKREELPEFVVRAGERRRIDLELRPQLDGDDYLAGVLEATATILRGRDAATITSTARASGDAPTAVSCYISTPTARHLYRLEFRADTHGGEIIREPCLIKVIA